MDQNADEFKSQSLLLGLLADLEYSQKLVRDDNTIQGVIFPTSTSGVVQLKNGSTCEINLTDELAGQLQRLADRFSLQRPSGAPRSWPTYDIKTECEAWGSVLFNLYQTGSQLLDWDFEPTYVSVVKEPGSFVKIFLRTLGGVTQIQIGLTAVSVDLAGDITVALMDGWVPIIRLANDDE